MLLSCYYIFLLILVKRNIANVLIIAGPGLERCTCSLVATGSAQVMAQYNSGFLVKLFFKTSPLILDALYEGNNKLNSRQCYEPMMSKVIWLWSSHFNHETGTINSFLQFLETIICLTIASWIRANFTLRGLNWILVFNHDKLKVFSTCLIKSLWLLCVVVIHCTIILKARRSKLYYLFELSWN